MKFIAELCQNHNGDIDNVLRMVDAAAAAGATHVKIQHIYAKNLTYRPEFELGLIQDDVVKSIHRPWEAEYSRLRNLELSDSECEKFVSHSQSVGLIPLTTCFTRGDIPRIKNQGFTSIKVASYDCASFPMLRELCASFDHLYVSTGATLDNEVIYGAEILSKSAKYYSLLHCVTQYPTPINQMHLNRITWLEQFSSEIGFSDHSLLERDGTLASKAAIACGARIVERHFTILDPNETKDGPVSITPQDLKELVAFSKLTTTDQLVLLDAKYPNWKIMLGDSNRELSDDELLNRDYYRGRFATPVRENANRRAEMIFNYEETPV
jgi:N,N'-diacetyllegionaminate synthase